MKDEVGSEQKILKNEPTCFWNKFEWEKISSIGFLFICPPVD